MRFARIKDGIVKDIIVLDDLNIKDLFSNGYDYFIEISSEPGSPNQGWLYTINDGFTSPIQIEPVLE